MRDKHRDESYFKDTVEYNKNRIKMTIENSKKIKNFEFDNKIKSRFNLVLNRYYFDLIKSMYSLGESYQEIEKVVNNYIETTCEYWTTNRGFETLLNTVSIVVLFKVSGDTLEKLKLLLTAGDGEKIVNDIVINELINYLDSSFGRKDGIILHSWIEDDIVKIINAEKTNRSKQLKEYMNAWYSKHNGNTWCGTHENDNENYAGYWSFEAAALAVVFGIDDSDLKDTDYYPYDLVQGHRKANLNDDNIDV